MANILELEFIYLPLGLPDANYLDYWRILEDISRSSSSSSESLFDPIRDHNQFARLKSICESARLVGGVGAVRAAAESFRPFQLESVDELELSGSACTRILHLAGNNVNAGKIFPGLLTTCKLLG